MKKILIMILGICCTLIAYAQQRTVSGIVTDSHNEAVIGASILEKGTSNGAITDLDGKFSLTLSSRGGVIYW